MSDASSNTKIINPKMSNIAHLIVNRHIANLIVLSDNFDCGGGSIKDDSESSSSYPSGNTNGHAGSVISGTNINPSALDLVEAREDELGTHLFINLFRSINGRKPSIKVVTTLTFRTIL